MKLHCDAVSVCFVFFHQLLGFRDITGFLYDLISRLDICITSLDSLCFLFEFFDIHLGGLIDLAEDSLNIVEPEQLASRIVELLPLESLRLLNIRA